MDYTETNYTLENGEITKNGTFSDELFNWTEKHFPNSDEMKEILSAGCDVTRFSNGNVAIHPVNNIPGLKPEFEALYFLIHESGLGWFYCEITPVKS